MQFTRYPGGIAGALKKIGGLAEGSRIRDAHAAEISHMFFGDAFAGVVLQSLRHAPAAGRADSGVGARISTGSFPRSSRYRPPRTAERALPARPCRLHLPAGSPLLAGGTPAPQGRSTPEPATRRIGAPQAEHLQGANQMIGDMPPLLLNAAREPFAAQAVVFALLLSRDDEAVRGRQLQMLQTQVEAPLLRQTQQLAAAAQSLPATARLPLVDMTIPAIKRSSPQQYAQFRQVVDALVAADEKIDLFEYCLRTVLFSYLDVHYGLKKPPVYSYWNVAGLMQPLAVVLSMLAHVGQEDDEQAERAFQAGAQSLPKKIEMLPLPECSLAKFDAALSKLGDSSPKVQARDHQSRRRLHHGRRPGHLGRGRAAAGRRRRPGLSHAAAAGVASFRELLPAALGTEVPSPRRRVATGAKPQAACRQSIPLILRNVCPTARNACGAQKKPPERLRPRGA